MTMTIRERETLQWFANKSHGTHSLQAVVAVLARVALKEEAIRIAQAPPGSLAIAKCARCGVDLFPGDDFNVREENGAAGCWRLFGMEGKPCFRDRGRAASRIDARRGETGTGSISEADESLTAESGDAQNTIPSSRERK